MGRDGTNGGGEADPEVRKTPQHMGVRAQAGIDHTLTPQKIRQPVRSKENGQKFEKDPSEIRQESVRPASTLGDIADRLWSAGRARRMTGA